MKLNTKTVALCTAVFLCITGLTLLVDPSSWGGEDLKDAPVGVTFSPVEEEEPALNPAYLDCHRALV